MKRKGYVLTSWIICIKHGIFIFPFKRKNFTRLFGFVCEELIRKKILALSHSRKREMASDMEEQNESFDSKLRPILST